MRYAPSPSPTLHKGRAFHPTSSNTVGTNSRPLGEGWGGAYTPSPGLRAKHATLGIYIIRYSNSVGVVLSRRRYPQQDSGQKCIGGHYYSHSDNALHQFPNHYPAKGDALGELVSAVTRARAISYVVTYQLLRGYVSTVTSHQCWPRAMHAGR